MGDFLRKEIAVPVFFLVLLVVGLFASGGYGISWDEKTQFALGTEAYETVFHGAEWPTDTGRRFHGPLVEFTLVSLQHVFGLHDAHDIFVMRHLVSFLLFFVGVYFFYVLARSVMGDWRWGLLGAALLVLSPRIFSHAFYNTRDIPAMVFFIIAMVTLRRFVDAPTDKRALIHALVTAMLLTIRLTGVLIPMLTLFFLGHTAWTRSKEKDIPGMSHTIALGVFYLLATAGCTVALWPLLWTHPLQHFLDAYRYMSTKVGGGGFQGFYMGSSKGGMIWHWIPVWIGITTPLLYTFFFLVGCGTFLVSAMRHPLRTLRDERDNMLFLLWILGPLVSIFAFHAGIFDTWRHLYFIYPAMLLFALTGIAIVHGILRRIAPERAMEIVVIPLVLSTLWTAGWMVVNHPMQDMYFSIPATYAEGNFELDYWGLGYREAIEHILAEDHDSVIPVAFTGSAGYSTLMILRPELRTRIAYGDQKTAKYFFDNFRWKDYQHLFKDELKVYSVVVDGMEAVSVYRNPNWKPIHFAPRFPNPIWNPYQDILGKNI